MSTSMSQIEIIQPDNNKPNFMLFPTRLSFSKDTECASKRRISGSQANYSKIYEKIQSIQMYKDKQANQVGTLSSVAQIQQSAAPYQQRDSITSGLSESVKTNTELYAHQRSLSYLVAPLTNQQVYQQPLNAKQQGNGLLPAVLNLQQQQKDQISKRRSVSTQPVINNNQGSSSTTSTASSQNNNSSDSPVIPYNSLLRSSLKLNNQNRISSNANNSSINYHKYINNQQQSHYFSENQIKSQLNHTAVHFRNNSSNSFSNYENTQPIDNSSMKNDSNNSNAAPMPTKMPRGNSNSHKNIRILMNPTEINKMRNSDTFQNNTSVISNSFSQQQPQIKERRIIRVNSILKKRNINYEQEHYDSHQNINLPTNESFEESNNSQVIQKECQSAIPFINGFDMCEINSSDTAKIQSNASSNFQSSDYINNVDQITRKRCNSASPKKFVKFDENVQVCNLHTSTKTQYKLSQKEMKQELIQQCSQFRKDLRLVRMQYQYQQQQQQKMKQEQLMFHLQELMTLSQQNQNQGTASIGSKSEISLTKFAPSLPIKQYTKFKVLQKLDKNQEQEKYLQKIEQIDKQYKQNLALKLQTTYSIKYFNQKQQQMQQQSQQQQQQQIQPQYQTNQLLQQQQIQPIKSNTKLFNNTLLKNLIAQ